MDGIIQLLKLCCRRVSNEYRGNVVMYKRPGMSQDPWDRHPKVKLPYLTVKAGEPFFLYVPMFSKFPTMQLCYFSE